MLSYARNVTKTVTAIELGAAALLTKLYIKRVQGRNP